MGVRHSSSLKIAINAVAHELLLTLAVQVFHRAPVDVVVASQGMARLVDSCAQVFVRDLVCGSVKLGLDDFKLRVDVPKESN